MSSFALWSGKLRSCIMVSWTVTQIALFHKSNLQKVIYESVKLWVEGYKACMKEKGDKFQRSPENLKALSLPREDLLGWLMGSLKSSSNWISPTVSQVFKAQKQELAEREAAVVAKVLSKEQKMEASEAAKRALEVKMDGKQCQATPNNTEFKSGKQWLQFLKSWNY
ncbi:hypothetical protein BCR33DRAFT_738668 [Rhizoclosmatium globosum]|uniref:Uncharacterized protein n=1 Tax=Rhizoclosmatium globosum TaxID=329046 RepID=A0A1Y2C905_9FUNG|nr:hypothetical protein BCR33DRAFT_738668 [Rhizoclosmatium globosum]|eukprot:ORY43397.1 hypothetical protein BCR33DRAFT_738668 [Rhizoclosmatium globosum]